MNGLDLDFNWFVSIKYIKIKKEVVNQSDREREREKSPCTGLSGDKQRQNDEIRPESCS